MYELLLLSSNLQTLLNMPTLIHPVHSVDGRNSLYSELHTKCCKPTCWHCVNRCWLVTCHYQWRCHTYRQCPHHPLSVEPCTVSTTPALKSPQSTTSSGLGVGVRVCAGVVNIGMMSAWVGVHVQKESPQSMPVISSSFHMTFGQMRQPIKPSKHSPLPYWELHGVCMSHILSDSGRQPVEEYTLWVTSEVKTHIALYIQVPVLGPCLCLQSDLYMHDCMYMYLCVPIPQLCTCQVTINGKVTTFSGSAELCSYLGMSQARISLIACWGKRDLRSLAWCLYTLWVGLDNGMWWYLCILYCILYIYIYYIIIL